MPDGGGQYRRNHSSSCSWDCRSRRPAASAGAGDPRRARRIRAAPPAAREASPLPTAVAAKSAAAVTSLRESRSLPTPAQPSLEHATPRT